MQYNRMVGRGLSEGRLAGEALAEEDRARFADLLVAVATTQDRAAFSELFAYYAPRVKSYLMRLGSDNAQAEEISQDVMVTVWRKASLFDRSQASVSTWIFRKARVRAAMKDLPGEQLQLLQLSFYEGLSHSEIAAKLDVPLGTVKSRIRLAFRKMKADLDEE